MSDGRADEDESRASDDSSAFAGWVAEVADRIGAGETVDLEAYYAAHPERADRLRGLVAAMERIGGHGSPPAPEPARAGDPIPEGLSPLGDYRILREIGRGGMGVVYEAEQISLGRRVALKVLPLQASGDRLILERFRREARAAARLHHTNIVPVYDVGQDGDVRYYAMQFIQGQGLDLVVAELRRLRDRARSGSRIGTALAGRETSARGEHARRRIEGPAAGEGARVSPVLQSLLSGRFDPGGRPQETTAAGSPTGRCGAGSDPALATTETGTAGDSAGEATALHRASTASASTTPASLPGGARLSSGESGPRAFFRSLAQIGRQVACGLAFAHARGIVHRDIKPPNLLLDTEGVVWIADFGLAKGDDEGLTQSGDILGTIRYMAPERFRGEGDARADVYALGLTLYELLTLRSGFDSRDRLRMIEQIKNEEPPRPRDVDPRIPRDLETIVLKAIEKDPRARYQSAEAMGEDLGRFLADEPIRARQVGAAERYWRWARRNPMIAALGAVLSAVLVLATCGSLLAAGRFARMADREREAARAEKAAHEDASRRAEAESIARDAAERSRAAAQVETYRALLSETKALRAGHQPGWRDESVANLARLAVMPTPRRDLVELRTEGVASLGDFDVKEVARLEGFRGFASSLDFSPDGRTLATAHAAGGVDFWDVPGRRHLRQILDPSGKSDTPGNVAGEPMPRVRYLPDGSLAYITWGHRVAFLEPRGSPSSRPPIEGGAANALRLAVDRRGRRLAVAWDDGRIDLHDAGTGALLHRSAQGFTPGIFALSPDGSALAVCGPDNTVLIRRIDRDVTAVAVGRHHARVNTLAFNADGSILASGSNDRTIKMWDLVRGEERPTLRGHTEQPVDLAFSPDGRWLASCGEDHTARLWDTWTGQSLAVLPGPWHMNNLAFSPDGGYLAVAAVAAPRTVILYQIVGRRERRRLVGHRNGAESLSFHPRRNRLASGANDCEMIVWDMESGTSLRRWKAHPTYVSALAYSPDGSTLASGNGTGVGDHSVALWDPDTGVLKRRLGGLDVGITALAFDPTGRRLAAGGDDGTVLIWDLEGGRVVRREQLGLPQPGVRSIAFLAEGRRILAGGGVSDGEIMLFDGDGTEPTRRVALADGWGRFVVDAPRNRAIVAGYKGSLSVLSLTDLSVVRRVKGHEGIAWSLALSPDGRLLATGGSDRLVVLRDAETLGPLLTFPAWTSVVKSIAFDRSGMKLAYAGIDPDVQTWDLGLVRDELAAIGLAWDQAAPAVTSTTDLATAGERSRPQVPVIRPGNRFSTGSGPSTNSDRSPIPGILDRDEEGSR